MTSGVRKSDIWNNSGRPNQYRPNLADPAQGATTILGATGPVEAKKWARTSHTQPVFFLLKTRHSFVNFSIAICNFHQIWQRHKNPPQRKIFKNIFLQCSSVDMFHRTAFVKIFRLGITCPPPKKQCSASNRYFILWPAYSPGEALQRDMFSPCCSARASYRVSISDQFLYMTVDVPFRSYGASKFSIAFSHFCLFCSQKMP